MIPYEELCSALLRFNARQRGEAPPSGAIPLGEDALIDDLPAEVTKIGAPMEPLADEAGQAAHLAEPPMPPDPSHELDVGDVLSDEELPSDEE